MPAPGRKPKAEGQARHRNKPRTEWMEVLNKPFQGEVPALPERDRKWPARVLEKWAVWSTMPHCVLWTSADWDFALDSLEIAAQFYETHTAAMASELRNREKLLGTTLDYRRDLRIRYVDAVATEEEPTTENVANIDDYRELSG